MVGLWTVDGWTVGRLEGCDRPVRLVSHARHADPESSVPLPPSATAKCEHEHRPGTLVCLHCRHTARLAARARRRQSAWRVGTAVLGATAVISTTALVTVVLRARFATAGQVPIRAITQAPVRSTTQVSAAGSVR